MDGDRQHALGAVLADHIIVEHLADLGRGRDSVAGLDQRRLRFLADDVVAQLDAFIADEHGRPGNELPDLVLRFAAERAVEGCSCRRRLKAWSFGSLQRSRVRPFPMGHASPLYRTINSAGALTPARLR